MNRVPGVVTAIVKSLEDPQGEGRIQVTFPWMEDGSDSAWAAIAFPMAGPRRGMYFMPEVDDEVLVAFEQGDFNYPYVIGFLWNGVDLPPDEQISFSVRRLRTVAGHELEFYDAEGEEKVWLKTQGGHQIELHDVDKRITIQTDGGQTIKMEDQPVKITIETAGHNKIEIVDLPASIKLSTAAGNSLEINDVPGSLKLTSATGTSLEVSGAPPSISVSAPAGMLNIQCLQATVNASMMSVNAPFVSFSGVVQATTLIATTVVGTTYTPGVGNLL